MYCTHFCLLLAFVFPVLTTGSWQDTVWCSTSDDVSCSHTESPKRDTNCDCPLEDSLCEKDKLGYEAICQLHRQIDDDHNGNLDRSESDEFIRDELNYKDGFDRQSAFHGADDLISVSDLWRLWITSPVYNWTTDDVVDWLVTYVELPQYAHNFRVNGVDGHMLPRIAVMNGHYVGSILGIKNSVHKKKLAVKAMDIVMFGPPKRHSYLKDLALIGSLVVAVGGCWLAYVQHSYSQTQMKKVMKDLDHLQASEQALSHLHQKLDVAQKEHKNIAEEKQKIERILKEEMNTAKHEAERLREVRETTAEEISRLKLAEEELVQVRKALRKAEKELDESNKTPLAQLQHWLQLNYEIENKHFEMKKESAEKELENAKEMCEKMRKKRSAFLGSLRIAHSASLDETDRKIMTARSSLEDVKLDLQERSSRWYEIEKICGFNITANPGLHTLSSMLNKSTGYLGYSMKFAGTSNLMSGLSGSVMSMGLGDSEEDQPPGYFAATGSRRKHTSSSNFNTSVGGMPLSSSAFSLTTKRRNLQPEKDSKTDTHEQHRFLSSKTQPELFNMEKSKLTTDFNMEKSKLTADLGKLDGLKASTDHSVIIPQPRQSTQEPRKVSPETYKLRHSFEKSNSECSNHSMEPFRVSQESLRLGRESFRMDNTAQDDFRVGKDFFKDIPAAFKIGQTAFKGSKDSKMENRDHGDTPYYSESEGRPRFDVGDACPQYEDLEENGGKMQVSSAKSGLVHSLHQNEQLYFQQKSLPSSLSDSSLLMVGSEVVKNKPSYPTKRLSPRSHLAMILDEDISSPESTDSTGPQDDKPKKKRLIRRTLLPKLLKNSPLADKQKVC